MSLPLRVSIAGYSFHGLFAGRRDWLEAYLDTVMSEFGLDVADIWNGVLGEEPGEYLTRPGMKRIEHALARRQMKVVNYHVDGATIWNADPDRRAHDLSVLEKHLELAARIGARTVRIDAGGEGSSWPPDVFACIVERYRAFCDVAQRDGFRVGPENHWGPEVVPQNMLALVEAVDHPAFGVLIHLNQWEASDPAVGDAMLAPHGMHLHVDEHMLDGPTEVAFRSMTSAGYRGHWSVEIGSGVNEIPLAHAVVEGLRSVHRI